MRTDQRGRFQRQIQSAERWSRASLTEGQVGTPRTLHRLDDRANRNRPDWGPRFSTTPFELRPPAFTLLQLQRTVEALAGRFVHKPNFRRLIEQLWSRRQGTRLESLFECLAEIPSRSPPTGRSHCPLPGMCQFLGVAFSSYFARSPWSSTALNGRLLPLRYQPRVSRLAHFCAGAKS